MRRFLQPVGASRTNTPSPAPPQGGAETFAKRAARQSTASRVDMRLANRPARPAFSTAGVGGIQVVRANPSSAAQHPRPIPSSLANMSVNAASTAASTGSFM